MSARKIPTRTFFLNGLIQDVSFGRYVRAYPPLLKRSEI